MFSGLGSVVLLPPVPVKVSVPLAGAGNVLVQMIESPTAKLAGLFGKQLCVAPAGKPLKPQVGASAVLGPALVHRADTVTSSPGNAVAGAVMVACMSDRVAMFTVFKSSLFEGAGSAVVDPARVVTLRAPLTGAAKLLLVQVMVLPLVNGLGSGLGSQLWVTPAGNPTKAQVGAAASLGPALVQVPLTVTVCPAVTLEGMVVLARMSA